MSMWKRVAGLACGVSAIGALSFAFAQGAQPDPRIANPALGAGQQSPFFTGMGETGLPPWAKPVQVAVITREAPPPVAVAPAPPPPAPVAQAPEPAPAPEPTTTMGAPPPEPPARADRN
jgi:translation initiation factor IF-2